MAISKSLSRSLSRSLSLVAPQETADEKYAASVRQAFGSFDKDGSGSIDASELKACLNSMGVFLSAEELDGLMGRMDTDGNGVIDLNEFAAAMHEHKENEELEQELEELKEVFVRIDKDGNGSLDAEELREAMKMLNISLTEAEAQCLLDEIDDDRSGAVTFDEFAKYVQNFDEFAGEPEDHAKR